MQKINEKLIAVEVPEDAYDFEWTTNQSVIPYIPELSYFVKCKTTGYPQGESINIGFPFNILGKLSELSEEECKRFVQFKSLKLLNVEAGHKGFMNYKKSNSEATYFTLDTAKESLISLIQSQGIDTSKELLIIEILQ